MWVECNKYGAKMKFYALVGDNYVRVSIELPLSLFGKYVKDNPKARTNWHYDWIKNPDFQFPHLLTYARTKWSGEFSDQQLVYDASELLKGTCEGAR